MNSHLVKSATLVTLAFSAVLFLQGCNRTEKNTEKPMAAPTQAGVSAETHAHAPGTPPHSHEAQLSTADWVELDHYRFKLAPEIEKGGQTHLDLYIHDIKDQHVANAKVLIHLTAADGHKAIVSLTEDKAAQHYMGKIVLDDLGDYQAVAQVTIKDQQLNPRFSFTRQQ